jgi:hypothetical protein
MQDLDVDRRSRVDLGATIEHRRRALQELAAPLRDLVRMHVECWARSASVFSPLMAAIATFALKAGLWFRRGRFVMIAPRFSAIFLPISSGFTTQRPCPDFPSQLYFACRALVVASGTCNLPHLPKVAEALPEGIKSLSAMHYRQAAQIDEGGVMVVGASASGTQIAWELQRAGRKVLMAVGEHVRAPRTYRGRDLQWWMDRAGMMDERYDTVEDLVRARTHPSLQLTGSEERMTLDLNALGDIGVRFVGRLAGIVGTRGQFSGSLCPPDTCPGGGRRR